MNGPRQRRNSVARLPGGEPVLTVIPDDWNGGLILYSQGPLATTDRPLWSDEHPVVSSFVDDGYAVTGWASTVFWHQEDAFQHQPAALELFLREFGTPDVTVAFGQSMGGLITAGLVQLYPDLVDGALPVCGGLGGSVAGANQMLDMAFVFHHLLAHEEPLEIANITNPDLNLKRALAYLDAASATPGGLARLSLLAAVTNIPGWATRQEAEPDADDFAARARAQAQWYREIVFMVVFGARAVIESRAGGNPAWNTGIDYSSFVQTSPNGPAAAALYEAAGLSLEADLQMLAEAPRVSASPTAKRHLEATGCFNGQLGVPVLTLHTIGDGLCTPDNESAYRDVVEWAGSEELLRQAFVSRAGHCTFTPAESLAALRALRERIRLGTWVGVDAQSLNKSAVESGAQYFIAADAFGGTPGEMAPAFREFAPAQFPRTYDVRHAGQSA